MFPQGASQGHAAIWLSIQKGQGSEEWAQQSNAGNNCRSFVQMFLRAIWQMGREMSCGTEVGPCRISSWFFQGLGTLLFHASILCLKSVYFCPLVLSMNRLEEADCELRDLYVVFSLRVHVKLVFS